MHYSEIHRSGPDVVICAIDAGSPRRDTSGMQTIAPSKLFSRIWTSVLVSGVFGWAMLCAVVLAMREPDATAAAGENAFFHALFGAVPKTLALVLCGGAVVAQYLCGGAPGACAGL